MTSEQEAWIQATTLEPEGNAETLVTYGDVQSHIWGWSPDSRLLLFTMGTYDQMPLGARLWVWDADSHEISLLNGAYVDCAAWGADGTVYWISSSLGEEGTTRLVGIRLTR